ncbi:MAG TPA: class I SAM-dependent methyltransferase [Alphaproteobacteria bacterium]|nr:class I SAM-dependent methyltransferase [Alphaproteobacteria bacterium]
MTDIATRDKWDAAAKSFDLLARGDERRFGETKRRFFAGIRGKTLFVAAGTGNDFKFFPPGHEIVAIDISPKMLERAKLKLGTYAGEIELREMDVTALDYPDDTFDTIATICTFCSVPKPVTGLRELHRVLKPGGRILMFEHVRSHIGPLGIMQDLMTPLTRRAGPDLNRDTVGNVRRAGFRIRRIENAYLDIVRMIDASKEPSAASP